MKSLYYLFIIIYYYYYCNYCCKTSQNNNPNRKLLVSTQGGISEVAVWAHFYLHLGRKHELDLTQCSARARTGHLSAVRLSCSEWKRGARTQRSLALACY